MDYNELIIILLYVVAIGGVILLFNSWTLGMIILVLLIIILSVKLVTDKRVAKISDNQKAFAEKVSSSLDKFSSGIEGIKTDIAGSFYSLENKIENQRIENEARIEKIYSDLAKKMVDIENRINEMKRWLGKE
jgi:ABC-type bacteriocin/lantibiotic exporter with double-glycine peptidase domain